MKTDCKAQSRRGFTLIELLAVIGIMLIVMMLVMPTLTRSQAIAVNSAGQMLQHQLSLARQTATARNRTVEVRFYDVPGKSGGQSYYQMFQLYLFDDKGANPAPFGKLIALPLGVIIEAKSSAASGAASACSSTLIDSAPHQGTQNLPSVGSGNYAYSSFRFRANGTTDLDRNGVGGSNGNTWYLLAHLASDPATGTTPPKNYFVVQVDPLTGQTQTFRP